MRAEWYPGNPAEVWRSAAPPGVQNRCRRRVTVGGAGAGCAGGRRRRGAVAGRGDVGGGGGATNVGGGGGGVTSVGAAGAVSPGSAALHRDPARTGPSAGISPASHCSNSAGVTVRRDSGATPGGGKGPSAGAVWALAAARQQDRRYRKWPPTAWRGLKDGLRSCDAEPRPSVVFPVVGARIPHAPAADNPPDTPCARRATTTPQFSPRISTALRSRYRAGRWRPGWWASRACAICRLSR